MMMMYEYYCTHKSTRNNNNERTIKNSITSLYRLYFEGFSILGTAALKFKKEKDEDLMALDLLERTRGVGLACASGALGGVGAAVGKVALSGVVDGLNDFDFGDFAAPEWYGL